MSKRVFWIFLIAISFLGLFVRLYNINYSSLWADELFSMATAHPQNSLYEIFYWQKSLQPPLYSLILLVWTSIFGYTDTCAKLLSIVAGTFGIFIAGVLGREIKNEKTGILVSLMVAFNPQQIWYSLEVRFYVFVFLFSALSIYLNLFLTRKRPANIFYYVLKSAVDCALCLIHHFGVLLVLASFITDLVHLSRDKDIRFFKRKSISYVLCGLGYLPWFVWGIISGLSIKEYWLKDIDIIGYFTYTLGYGAVINTLGLGSLVFYFLKSFAKKDIVADYFLLILLLCLGIPLAYSYLRLPILVGRYSMVMAPVIYITICIGFVHLFDFIQISFGKLKYILVVLLIFIFVYKGLYISFLDRLYLKKQPWKEMAAYIKSQPDFRTTPIYSMPVWFKNFMNIDFYLSGNYSNTKSIYGMKLGVEKEMYLVESSGYLQFNPEFLRELHELYHVKVIKFNSGLEAFGNVYRCSLKHQE